VVRAVVAAALEAVQVELPGEALELAGGEVALHDDLHEHVDVVHAEGPAVGHPRHDARQAVLVHRLQQVVQHEGERQLGAALGHRGQRLARHGDGLRRVRHGLRLPLAVPLQLLLLLELLLRRREGRAHAGRHLHHAVAAHAADVELEHVLLSLLLLWLLLRLLLLWLLPFLRLQRLEVEEHVHVHAAHGDDDDNDLFCFACLSCFGIDVYDVYDMTR